MFYLSTLAVKEENSFHFFLGEDIQLNNFSIGINQQLFLQKTIAYNFGINTSIRFQNIKFGMHFSFPFRQIGKAWGSNNFQLYSIFDFTDYRYRSDTNSHLSQDNY
jgi:hypothetical protein